MIDGGSLPAWHRRIISGQSGVWSVPIRWMLGAASRPYALCVAARNSMLDRRKATRLGVPVVSVGNITTGGTGKTPMVIHISQRLMQRGCTVAVVSRGYHGSTAGSGQANDEQQLIQRRCPDVICVSDPDRVRGARSVARVGDPLDQAVAGRALDDCRADVIVLDDAFQHRRLHRDLDIVLIDATCPFGFDHLLPRGLLREPLDQLRRASLIIITRVDQVSQSVVNVIIERLQGVIDGAAILQCRHQPTSVWMLDANVTSGTRFLTVAARLDSTERSAMSLEGKRVVCFAGIGNPGAFETTVAKMGATVVGCKWWPDHYAYHPSDLHDLGCAGRFPPFDLLVTTEKDAVKLASLRLSISEKIAVVGVQIELLRGGDTILSGMLDDLLQSS